MTEQRGSWPDGIGEPVVTVVTTTAEPDWQAMADRHEEQRRRRKQLRAVAVGVVATAAVGGMVALALPGGGKGQAAKDGGSGGSGRPVAAGEDTASVPVADESSPTGDPSATAPGEASPAASAPASGEAVPSPGAPGTSAAPSAPGPGRTSAGPTRPATTAPGQPTPPAATQGPQPPATQPAPGTTSARPPSPTPTQSPGKSYTPVEICGSGFNVIDSHSLGGATIYLLYKSATGDNCVTTVVNKPAGPVPMNATLAVKGGASGSNPGNFASYAGPVVKRAPDTCVQWGGSYQGTSWTSGWTHCG
ncbi:hypothetical protein ACIA8O_30765 [Kitasatospora sp. NPDC051853]|uniref:hypothetical protein n=1 Tax=Kitasatospora sp. NPDC051853 TaxID=3364058 RepID=UPI0037BA9D76